MGSERSENRRKEKDAERKQVQSLIQRVRMGEQEAFSVLLDRYRPLIEASVFRFRNDRNEEKLPLHEDDLRQEATVVFYNSILSYDLEQNEVEFGLYAKICISNALVSQLRQQRKQRQAQSAELANANLGVGESEDPTEGILERERTEALYSVIRKHLSDFEYRVWHEYVAGRTAKEIGVRMGKDEKSISNAIYRIRKKLRAVLQ